MRAANVASNIGQAPPFYTTAFWIKVVRLASHSVEVEHGCGKLLQRAARRAHTVRAEPEGARAPGPRQRRVHQQAGAYTRSDFRST
jgi:hypothetical protein